MHSATILALSLSLSLVLMINFGVHIGAGLYLGC